MINLGLFYQSGNNLTACYHAIKQFRKFYINSPIALYEDNSNILEPVAKKFNCSYAKTDVQGIMGRPAFNLKSTLAWLNRVYEACTTTLSSVDWVMHFEDDVWIRKEITGVPPYDLSGIPGIGWGLKLYEHLKIKPIPVFGCGGAIFNRLKFIEAYNKSKSIDWNLMDELSINPKPSEWTDSALTLLFVCAGLTLGPWEQLSAYRNQEVNCLAGRHGWPGSINELEEKQGVASVIHCWKPYYWPTDDEVQYVKKSIQNDI